MKGIIKNRRHGLSRHPLYKVWKTMVHSCYKEKHIGFINNGALGIKVCERWLLVENFIEDVGFKPNEMCFSKKDPTQDYGPDNWEWVSRKELIRKGKVTKLTKDQIIEIREEKLTNSHSYVYLAKKYNCTTANIRHIFNGKSWVD